MSGWRLVPLMMAMFLIGSAEVMAGPMMKEMGMHFGVPVARIAWLPASYALVYASLAPFLGPLSDRLGRKALLLPGLVGFGVAAMSIPLAPSFPFALAGSAFTGLCAAAIQPNALATINDTVPVEAQPAATGRVFMGLTLSFVVTPVISALLASRVDWRAAYVLVGAGAVLTAVLGRRLPEQRATTAQPIGFSSAFRKALGIHGIRRRLAASFLWIGLAAGTTTILAEVFRRRFGLQTETTGMLAGAFGLATMTGNLLVARVGRQASARSRVLMGGVTATIGGSLVVGVLPPFSIEVAMVAALLWALGFSIAGPIHHSTLGHLSGPVRGTVIALNASLLNLGIMVVTLSAGRFFDEVGVEAVMGGTIFGMLLGLVLLLTIPPGLRAPDEPPGPQRHTDAQSAANVEEAMVSKQGSLEVPR